MTKQQHDRLIARIRMHWGESCDVNLSNANRRLADERMLQAYKECAERLPRVPVGRCPFAGEILKRSNASWTIANDIWDFDLEPYLADGRLRWIDPDDAQHLVRTQGEGRRCPFIGLPGDHRPQVIASHGRDLRDLPNGEVIYPFED